MLLSKKIMSNFIKEIENVENQKIVDALNSIGAEVESVKCFPKIDYLRIGKLINIKKHPHDDKLTVCSVQTALSKINEIICGAENVRNKSAIGKYVIVALLGAELPNGKIIGDKNIKGIHSEGMLCSYSELNPIYKKYVSDKDLDNVILLENAKLGDSQIQKYLNIDDSVFDITIPTNRSDWQGLRFICRELAAYLNLKFIELEKHFKHSTTHKFIMNPIKVINSDTTSCNYFDAIYLKNKTIKESSWILKGTLINNCIKPINDIIDNSALISIITGNPIHIYDAKKICGELILKKAVQTTEMIGLDNKIYKIMPNDLIVCDREKIVALAGIIGSKDSMVTDETTDFLIEVGNFKKTIISNTAERLNANTLASKMFSKDINIYATNLTIQYLVEYLLKENISQQIALPSKKIKINEYHRKIMIDFNNIRNLLGDNKNLSDFKIKTILKNIGFGISGKTVFVPSYRNDILVWQDITEEIVKMININNFNSEPIIADYLLNQDNKTYDMIQNLNQKLLSLQISSVHTYNLTNYEDAINFNFFKYETPIKISNSQSEEKKYFRLNIISNLLKILQYNKRHKNNLRPIYELQSILYKEFSDRHIGMVIPTKLFDNHYDKNNGVVKNLLTIKGLSDLIVNNFGFRCDYKTIEKSEYLVITDSLQLVVYEEVIGYIGRIRPSILKQYDLGDLEIYALDINLEKLITSLNRIQYQYEPFGKLNNIDRDITFMIPYNCSFYDFIKVIENIPQIVKWELILKYKHQNNSSNDNDVRYSKIINRLSNISKIPLMLNSLNINSDIVNLNDIDTINYSLQDQNLVKNNESKLVDNHLSSISYTVRYYIQQIDKTLSINEINEISNKLISECEHIGLCVKK